MQWMVVPWSEFVHCVKILRKCTSHGKDHYYGCRTVNYSALYFAAVASFFFAFTSTCIQCLSLLSFDRAKVYHMLEQRLMFNVWPIPPMNFRICGRRVHNFDGIFESLTFVSLLFRITTAPMYVIVKVDPVMLHSCLRMRWEKLVIFTPAISSLCLQ